MFGQAEKTRSLQGGSRRTNPQAPFVTSQGGDFHHMLFEKWTLPVVGNFARNGFITFKVPSKVKVNVFPSCCKWETAKHKAGKLRWCLPDNRGAIHLHQCLEGGLPQRPSWSSAPSSPRSDSGSESLAPGSRRGHRGRRQGSRLRREKGRSDLRRGRREKEKEVGWGGAMMKETKEEKRRFRDQFNQIWITHSILAHATLLTLPGDFWCGCDLKRKPISCGQKPFRPPMRILWFPGSQNVEEGICLAVKLASRW